MRIRFEFQGGYGGLFAAKPLTYDVETDQLPDEVRTRLLRLIQEAGILGAGEQGDVAEAGRGRDTYNYRLWIRDRGVSRSLTFDDATASSEVRPLLQFLQQLALEKRQSGG